MSRAAPALDDAAMAPAGGSWPSRYPATATVAALTAALGVAALLSPALVRALQQVPRSLWHGQWWRVVSPMLVQGYGIRQFVFNLVGIVVVGVAVGGRYGAWRWLVIYFGAGVAGIVLTSLWFPHQTDSGASAGVAGLIAATVVAMLADRAAPPWPAFLYAVLFAVYLAAQGFGDEDLAVVLACLVTPAMAALRRYAPGPVLRAATTLVIVGAGAAMLAIGDIHGVGLAAGVLAGAVLLPRRLRRHLPADLSGIDSTS